MAQPGNFTPILLYGSSTPTNVPLAANLTNSATGSEIAINVADKNLFFKDSGGVVNTVPIRQSSTSSNGWLSSTDWNTFNSKAPATSGTSILYGNGSGGFSNVTIGSGISFAGGTLSATGTGGTVTSVAALTLGTTGTDLSSTVANGTTTPVITLNVPTASASNRGALSAADWSTFNSKAPGVTFTTAYVPFGQGSTTLNQASNFNFNGTTLVPGAAIDFSGNTATVPSYGMRSLSGLGTQICSAYQLSVYVNGAERMWFSNTGGVSIGNQTDPGATNLSVSGSIAIGTANSEGKLAVKSPNTTGGTRIVSVKQNNGTDLFVLFESGGTYATGVYAATTAGAANVNVATDGALQRSTSSIKYKTNVKDSPHGLAEVLKLRSVLYKGINDGDTIFGGLIAEEVHEAGLTEFVVYGADGKPDSLAYGNMVSLAFKAIEQLNEKFDAYVASHP